MTRSNVVIRCGFFNATKSFDSSVKLTVDTRTVDECGANAVSIIYEKIKK